MPIIESAHLCTPDYVYLCLDAKVTHTRVAVVEIELWLGARFGKQERAFTRGNKWKLTADAREIDTPTNQNTARGTRLRHPTKKGDTYLVGYCVALSSTTQLI